MKDCDAFLFEIIKLRKKYKFETKNILNCDETAVCLNNFANKTIIKKGTKTVNCKTLKREKMRITVLLTITGDGKFLPPFIIFKGEKQNKLYKNIQNYEEIKNKKIIATTQNNAWIDTDTFKEYINKILVPYNQLDKKLLIMDKCTTHCKEYIKFLLNENNYIISYIPSGMIMVLQPLDRSINFPFKCYLKDKFTSFLLANKDIINEKIDDCRKRVVKDIYEIIYKTNNDKNIGHLIREEIIIKSFKICGITNEMTGDEDYLFDGFDVINKLTLIKNRRTNDNGNKAQSSKYSRRNESDSSSEGENGEDENIDN